MNEKGPRGGRGVEPKEKEKVVVHLNEFEFNPEPSALVCNDMRDMKARTGNKKASPPKDFSEEV